MPLTDALTELRARTRGAGARTGAPRTGGPLPALPDGLDRLSERWFELTARRRVALTAAGVAAVVLLAATLGARSPWGPDVTVLVAARPVPAGTTLAPGDLVPRVRPRDALPEELVDASTSWVGTVTTGPIPAGGVVASAHLAEDGLGGVLAPGRVAVAVPAGLIPSLAPGRRVDLVGGGADLGERSVARDGRVLAVDAEHVWIEVDRADAAAVAAAVAWGQVTVALLGG